MMSTTLNAETASAARTQQVLDALAEEGATLQTVALMLGISVEGVKYHVNKAKRQGTLLPVQEALPLLVKIAGETAQEQARVSAQLASAQALLRDTQARVAELEAENAKLIAAFAVLGVAVPE
jgi:DNA-binding CsgD family transcriptional regulator